MDKQIMKSEAIRLVAEGKFQPEDIDSALKNLKKENEELKYELMLKQQEIVKLRRWVEVLEGKHGNHS